MFECPCEHSRLLLCWNGQHQCNRSLLSRILLPRRSGQCHTLRLQLYHGSLLPGRVRLSCAMRCWVIPRQRGVYFLFTMPSWKVSWLICIYLHPHSEFEWVILHTCVYTFHVHNSVIFDSVKKNMKLTENDWKSVCCFETILEISVHTHARVKIISISKLLTPLLFGVFFIQLLWSSWSCSISRNQWNRGCDPNRLPPGTLLPLEHPQQYLISLSHRNLQ